MGKWRLKMDKVFSNLSLTEKLKLLTGKDFWHTEDLNGKVASITFSDGPHGLRKCEGEKELEAVSFPTLSSLGNTWNKDLAYLEGRLIASACVENGVDVILGPGVNIKRSPFCGRNFEYFSEDPLLSGVLAKAYIKGVQDLGIGACLKHFACNNYEYEREFRSSEVDERTLFEIYLRPFEIALEANPWCLMPSYNCVNGIYSCENKYLLKDVLRDKFKYTGYLISDWGAVHNSAKSLKAGLDLRMAYDEKAIKELSEAYDKNYIDAKEIDNSINNLSKLISKTKNDKKKVLFNKEESHLNAVDIAKESIVLLKNENNILPLKKTDKVLVTGSSSINPPFGGGGSSCVRSSYKSKSLEELLNLNGIKSECRPGYNSFSVFETSVMLQRASVNDVAIVTVSVEKEAFAEGFDRTSIKLSKVQENIIHQLASKIKTVVVIYCGGVIDVSTWSNEVDGIVFAGYGGEGINEALADVLLGKTNPSGKLSETFITCEDNEFVDGVNSTDSVVRYSEGVFVGYRRMNDPNYKIIYPFGYGLSYSNFEYSSLRINKLGETDYEVFVDIENTSDIDGKEVVQLYVSDLSSSVSRPLRELKGFEKVFIPAREKKTVSFKLDRSSFAFYNASIHDWYVENGLFEIQIGSSSIDIKLREKIDIELDFYSQYSRER